MRSVAPWALLIGVAIGLGACGSSPTRAGPPPPASAAAPTSTHPPASTAPPSTAPPSTAYLPSGAAPDPDAAALALVRAWAAGNRAAAAAVATPAAVSALLALPYPGPALTLDRGCGQQPIVCTIGPNGGANPNDAIYQFTMAQAPSGWYVASVTVEQ